MIEGLAAEPLPGPAPESRLKEAQTSEDETDWLMLAGLFGAGNLLLLIAGGAFWLVKRGSADQINRLTMRRQWMRGVAG